MLLCFWELGAEKNEMKKITKLFVLAALLMAGSQIHAQEEHQYVDLGLPSGTLWATCNVGATTPEGYGDYFAWGETAPKDNVYNDKTYQLYNNFRLTKYCSTSGFKGLKDNLTQLQSVDDAATINWGDGWRIPTKAQWEELLQNTTQEWTELNGVNGCLFTAGNGNSVFLPAASRIVEISVPGGLGLEGVYWTSSRHTDYDTNAWYYAMSKYNKGMDFDKRYWGCSIRPVRFEPKK